MQKELQALIQLIESWEKDNLEIAKQIMKGDSALKTAIKKRYDPVLSKLLGLSILSIEKVPHKIKNLNLSSFDLGEHEELASFFHNMPIESLYYSYQEVTEIPNWICELRRLSYLNLSHNKITEIPKNIQNLKGLKELNLDYNEIGEIPPQISALSNLVELRLANNKIQEIPPAVFKLRKLFKIQLDFNEIDEVPKEIGLLTELSSLCLERNKLRTLPETMLNLQKLSWLSIEGTPLGDLFDLTYGMYINVNSPDFVKYIEAEA